MHRGPRCHPARRASGARAPLIRCGAAELDINQPVTLTGVLTKMEWVNPHGWIYVDVKTPDGKVENWAIEAGAPTALLRRGLRKTDFPSGIELTIEGYRARSGALVANGVSAKTKEGKNFFLGGPQQGDNDYGDAPRP